MLSVIYEEEYGSQHLVLRVIRRTTNAAGEVFLTLDYELEGWWTTLAEDCRIGNDGPPEIKKHFRYHHENKDVTDSGISRFRTLRVDGLLVIPKCQLYQGLRRYLLKKSKNESAKYKITTPAAHHSPQGVNKSAGLADSGTIMHFFRAFL